MKFKKIEFARQTNFILALLLIHFAFFGYLSNVLPKFADPAFDITSEANFLLGSKILFLYQVLFDPVSYLSVIILVLIVFIMVFREHFFEYGLRNSIWLIPFIIIESWIWYWFIVEDFDIGIIGAYFLRIESYITILTLLGLNLTTAIVASIAREKYNAFLKRYKKIEE